MLGHFHGNNTVDRSAGFICQSLADFLQQTLLFCFGNQRNVAVEEGELARRTELQRSPQTVFTTQTEKPLHNLQKTYYKSKRCFKISSKLSFASAYCKSCLRLKLIKSQLYKWVPFSCSSQLCNLSTAPAVSLLSDAQLPCCGFSLFLFLTNVHKPSKRASIRLPRFDVRCTVKGIQPRSFW